MRFVVAAGAARAAQPSKQSLSFGLFVSQRKGHGYRGGVDQAANPDRCGKYVKPDTQVVHGSPGVMRET